MKIQCEKVDLVRGIQVVQNALTSTTLPILSHVLMIAEGEKVRLVATNLETTIESSFSAKILQEGRICLPGGKVFEIMREAPSPRVDLEVSDNKATIACGRAIFHLLCLEASEFPELPKLEKENVFSLPQEVLREMVQKTFFAASSDETRPSLNGVYMAIKDGEMRMVATDGRRLSFIKASSSSLREIPPVEAIVPLRALRQLMRILGKGEEVRIGLSKHQVFFQLDDILLISQLIEAEFPDYEKVIPKEYNVAILTDKDELFGVIRRISLLSDEKSRLIKFELKENTLLVSSNNPEMGYAQEELTVKREGEGALKVGFNYTYLLDVLKNMKGEVRLELIDPLSPGVIRPAEDKDYVCVVMPIRIEEG